MFRIALALLALPILAADSGVPLWKPDDAGPLWPDSGTATFHWIGDCPGCLQLYGYGVRYPTCQAEVIRVNGVDVTLSGGYFGLAASFDEFLYGYASSHGFPSVAPDCGTGTSLTVTFSKPAKNVILGTIPYPAASPLLGGPFGATTTAEGTKPVLIWPDPPDPDSFASEWLFVPGPVKTFDVTRQPKLPAATIIGIFGLGFQVADSSYIVKAAAMTDDLPVFERKSGVTNITVPLGAEFEVGLEKTAAGSTLLTGTPVKSSFTISNQFMTEPLATDTLFRDMTVFAYASSQPEELKTFQAIHLGTATLSILPAGETTPTTVSVTVVPPLHLGMDKNDWWVDDDVIKFANKAGMLPQNVKGQIQQESAGGEIGSRENYVYEPCRDMDTIQPVITTEPYLHYRAPNPRGDLLADADLDPRNQYSRLSDDDLQRLYGDGQPLAGPPYPRTAMTSADVDIPIASVFAANDCTFRKNGRCHGANWSYTCSKSMIERITGNHYAASRMVAQTPTAASYGWLQVMYYEAIAKKWKGAIVNAATGERSKAPHYLFDTRENLDNEGGSLFFGNFENVLNYEKRIGNQGDPNAFRTPQDFLHNLRIIYHWYNSAWRSQKGEVPYYPNYETAVFERAKHFRPVRADSILK